MNKDNRIYVEQIYFTELYILQTPFTKVEIFEKKSLQMRNSKIP